MNGASDVVFRGLSFTETYLKKARKTVFKMMQLQWINEFDIDTLKSKGHWAPPKELLEVFACYLIASLLERT